MRDKLILWWALARLAALGLVSSLSMCASIFIGGALFVATLAALCSGNWLNVILYLLQGIVASVVAYYSIKLNHYVVRRTHPLWP